jgi:hypothetical protein
VGAIAARPVSKIRKAIKSLWGLNLVVCVVLSVVGVGVARLDNLELRENVLKRGRHHKRYVESGAN